MKKESKTKTRNNEYLKQRMIMVAFGFISISTAVVIILTIFNDNIVFFYTPTDVASGKAPRGEFIRIGGLVKDDLKKDTDTNVNIFTLTDNAYDVIVNFSGIMPDLFRKGQGIVAEGKLLEENIFVASNLLAKHDENYMPPEVADSLKKSGYWKENRE